MRRAGLGVGYVALIAAAGIALFPIYWMVVTSLRPKAVTLVWPPQLVPDLEDLSLDTYASLVTETAITTWVTNSLVVAGASTAITVVVATLAGYALSRSRHFESRALGYAVLLSKMLPGTLLVVPLYVLFHRAGLLGTLPSVILANVSFALPFATWMMKGFFDTIPLEIEEAALCDGDTLLQALCRILLPLVMPAVGAVTIYVFIVSWNDLIFARTFLPGGENTTLTAASTQFLGEVEMEWNKVMAIATIATIPVALVFIALERHFVAGLTKGYH